jgi:hypothetical protein
MVTIVFNKPAIFVLLVEVIGTGLWVGYMARLNGWAEQENWQVKHRAEKVLFMVIAGESWLKLHNMFINLYMSVDKVALAVLEGHEYMNSNLININSNA